MKKKDLILVAVIIVIAIVMYIIMNQMQSDNGEIVKITVDGNVYNVTVEEGTGSTAGAAKAAAPKAAAPAPKAAPAAPKAAAPAAGAGWR